MDIDLTYHDTLSGNSDITFDFFNRKFVKFQSNIFLDLPQIITKKTQGLHPQRIWVCVYAYVFHTLQMF